MQLNNIDGIITLPPLLAEYRLDPTVEITHNKIAYEQGYSYEYHTMLKNTRDYSLNKDSNFYLTDEYNLQNILSVKELPIVYPETISTFLAFNRLNNDPLSALSADATCLTSASAVSALTATDTDTIYITVGEKTDSTMEEFPLGAELFTDIKTESTLQQKYYFNITFIDGMECLVYHLSGDTRLYLHVDKTEGVEDDPALSFTPIEHEYGLENIIPEVLASSGAGSSEPGEKIKWLYTYYREENLIRIYKELNGVMKVVSYNEPAKTIELVDLNNVDEDGDNTTFAPNVLELTDSSTIRLRPLTTRVRDSRVNSKIFNYKNTYDQNNVLVNTDRSSEELANNMLVHSEYYYLTGATLPVNLFPLKNQQTSTGIVKQGNLWSEESTYKHRRYNKLFTGTNQLQGTDKIYLDYTCSSHDIEFNPGMNFFNFPGEPEPVDRININDTKLIECGSIASNKPITSDKVYKKLSGYRDTTRWGNPSNEQTGMWLCTWLSGSNDPGEVPVWVDRYYNPSNTGGVAALSVTTQHNHNIQEQDTDDQFISSNEEVYDEVSKLTFEPGSSYAYYRLDDIDNTNALSILDPFYVCSGLDTYTTTNYQPKESTDGTYTFNHDRVGTITSLKDNDLDQLTIMFDFNFNNYKQLIGHQILGNYTNTGFGLFNTNNVSPFLFLLGSDGVDAADQPKANPNRPQNSSIRIYDNNFNLYNYTTNSSYVPVIKQLNALNDNALEDFYTVKTGTFEYIITRELPDNIYAVMSTGQVVEMTHDGTVVATYDQVYNNVSGPRDSTVGVNAVHSWPTHTLQDVTYDETYIYILQHKIDPTNKTDYIITAFNTLDKTFADYTNYECMNIIPVPPGLGTDNNESDPNNPASQITFGRHLDNTLPPTKIFIKDDPVPYHDHRSLYLAWGDLIKTTTKTIWVYVSGAFDTASSQQSKHDVIYGYDTKKLELIGNDAPGISKASAPGMITGNLNTLKTTGGAATITPLSIIDFTCDVDDNLWLLHDTNHVTKISSTREILHTHVVEDQSLLSILITKDLEAGDYVDRVSILGKTTGADQLQASVSNHATSIITSPAYRSASPYPDPIDASMELVQRVTEPSLSGMTTNTIPDQYSAGWYLVTSSNRQYINENNIWLSGTGEEWVYISDLIYPFVNGADRFIQHQRGVPIGNMGTADQTGTVREGDYDLITEQFDELILDDYPDTIFGNIYEVSNGKLVDTIVLDNFPTNDVTNLPQMYNHYEYSRENYNHYAEYNLNLKILLQPLFGRVSPDMVNLKVDLTTLNSAPYTGKHHLAIVVDNKNGRVEMWIDGALDETRIYEFDSNKYKFGDILNKNITVGATPYLNDTLLYGKLTRNESYVITDTVLENIKCYKIALDYNQQLSVIRSSEISESMTWSLPVGLRNYIEGIDRVYNHSIPPKKSNTFDVQIRNSLIESTSLQDYITNKLSTVLTEVIPAGTTYRDIQWTNEILNQS
jgi:hypothetical protein